MHHEARKVHRSRRGDISLSFLSLFLFLFLFIFSYFIRSLFGLRGGSLQGCIGNVPPSLEKY